MNFQKLIIAASLVVFVSCKKTETPAPADNGSTAKTMLDVAYGVDALQKMDIYLPAGRSTPNTKVLVMIHGGGWYQGDKTDFTQYVDTMRRRFPEYAIFNLNYRLSTTPANVFPTQENDVKAAMQFIYNKSAEYFISDKYILVGASAGGHLAMLQAYKYAVPVKPKAVVSFFGPSDLTDMYNNPANGNASLALGLALVVGKTPAQDAAIYTNSSPVTFISASTAMPTILLHGGVDPLVAASQSVAVKNKLTTAGIANQYVFYPTGGHGDWNNATYFDAFSKVDAFLRLYVP